MILKRKPHLYQWFGMLICVVGIVIVGIASNKSSGDDDETSRLNAVGNTLVVVAMLLSAVEDVKRRIADGQPAFDPTLNDEVVSPVTAWIKVRNERGSDGVL